MVDALDACGLPLRLQPLHDHVVEQHQHVDGKCHGYDRIEEGEVAEARVVVGQAPTEGDEEQDVGGRGFDPPGVVAQEEGEPRDQDDQEDRQEDLEQIVIEMARRAEAEGQAGYGFVGGGGRYGCLLYTSPSPRDRTRSRMPSSA